MILLYFVFENFKLKKKFVKDDVNIGSDFICT